MRYLILVIFVTVGYAATATAHHSGAKSKSDANSAAQRHQAQPRSRRSEDDRRSAVGSVYQFQDFPLWAARAMEPRRAGP